MVLFRTAKSVTSGVEWVPSGIWVALMELPLCDNSYCNNLVKLALLRYFSIVPRNMFGVKVANKNPFPASFNQQLYICLHNFAWRVMYRIECNN